MDFSHAFKNQGRRGVGMKKKKKKKAAEDGENFDSDGNLVGEDPLDEDNVDLEDENFL